MSNYLKKFLFAALIFMMPYMNSASKAMDTEDHEGSSVRAHKVSLMTDDQDVSSSVKQSTSSQISLDDSKISWASYLSSPVKTVIQNTAKIIDFATQSPQKAFLVGAILTCQVMEVASRYYFCFNVCRDGSTYEGLGYPTESRCYESCTLNNCTIYKWCAGTGGGCAKTYCADVL